MEQGRINVGKQAGREHIPNTSDDLIKMLMDA